MDETEVDELNDFWPELVAGWMMPVDAALAEKPAIERAIAVSDGLYTAGVLSGLLTVPELQSNCYRIETLAHAAVALGKGNRKPPKSSIGAWFKELEEGVCGRMEDPAEDVFVTVVTTQRGNFRILEGTWESAGFYLQRFINVMEDMPDEGAFKLIKDSTYAILQISDLICERAGLRRYQCGRRYPLKSIPKDVLDDLQSCRKRVSFSRSELFEATIDCDDLQPFVLDSRLERKLMNSCLSRSPLVHHPLLLSDDQLVVALPTAISVAIRVLLIDWTNRLNLRKTFRNAIAREYARFFRSNPPLSTPHGAPIAFRETENGPEAVYGLEVDKGRFVQFIFAADSLDGFERTGLAAPPERANPNPRSFEQDIERFRSEVSNSKDFKEGLTIVVGCGIGRPEHYVLSESKRDNWRAVFLSAPDLTTLSLLGDVTSLTLFRLLDAESELESRGIRYMNVNGLPNLIAWVRSLDGHLVPHGQVPEGFREGRGGVIMLETSFVLDIRREATERIDQHAAPTVDGRWMEVRKIDSSYFEEDRKLPLYAATEFDEDENLPLVFESTDRHWWCKIPRSHGYDRWKMMSTWLPKIAIALDNEVPTLPKRLLVSVKFEGRSEQLDRDRTVTLEEIKQAIVVRADSVHQTVEVVADGRFEHGLAHPHNIAEAALIEAVVEGVLLLVEHNDPGIAASYRERIVPDVHARDGHVFCAREFRDYIRELLPRKVIGADEIDHAALRLGLGWRARQNGSAEITGKEECTTFLNQIVAISEQGLCEQLRRFNRRALLELALNNYESATHQRSVWRRTAAANIALHADKPGAIATMAEHESKMNGALLGSRLIAEVATCECPVDGGTEPGSLDLSRLLARALLIHSYGGWSDAIYLDAMPPSLTVTPLGDIHGNLSFFNTVVDPFHHASHDSMLKSSISEYSSNFQIREPAGAVEAIFAPKFIAAWKEERLHSLDDYRRFIDEVEDHAIAKECAVVTLRRSDLLSLCPHALANPLALVNSLTFIPRASWQTITPGFDRRDCRLWRFRRQLSLLRFPIIQLSDSEDPLLMVAPGILRDALGYMVRCYHEGSFPHYQLKSTSMRSWAGHVADKRGSTFALEVAEELTKHGWKTETEVAVTKILRIGSEAKKYGDVDVLAYHETKGRILLIECKDLHYHKTPGELAEQLRDFRGATTGDGKRDELKRHLDRREVLLGHKDRMVSYLKASADPSVEAWVVFRNPVPMLFAWKDFEQLVKITTFDKLSEI